MSARVTHRLFLFLGALQAASAVGVGAFGAHALPSSLGDAMRAVYETAVRYQFYHALGLCLIALVVGRFPGRRLPVASGWLLLAGSAIFCGSLYLLVLTGAKWLGAVTPLGGACFIVGWMLLAVSSVGGEEQ